MRRIVMLPRFPEMYEEYGAGHYHFAYRRMVVDDYLVFYAVCTSSLICDSCRGASGTTKVSGIHSGSEINPINL